MSEKLKVIEHKGEQFVLFPVKDFKKLMETMGVLISDFETLVDNAETLDNIK